MLLDCCSLPSLRAACGLLLRERVCSFERTCVANLTFEHSNKTLFPPRSWTFDNRGFETHTYTHVALGTILGRYSSRSKCRLRAGRLLLYDAESACTSSGSELVCQRNQNYLSVGQRRSHPPSWSDTLHAR